MKKIGFLVLAVGSFISSDLRANLFCVPSCNPLEHCLKGQCVSQTPLQNRCYTDIDCHPGRCGSDGICYNSLDELFNAEEALEQFSLAE